MKGSSEMNQHLIFVAIIVCFVLTAVVVGPTAHAASELMVFAGAASKPPTEEAAKAFEEKHKIKVLLTFGGSGFVLSQMLLGHKGDLYFPGSSDFMEVAKRKGAVFPETEQIVVYLVPAINVQKGNPKNIRTLRDLSRPGLKIAIANPETVCVGTYAVEIVERNLSPSEKGSFLKNLVNYTESCEKTATAVSLKTVDAALGWRVFQYWDPDRIETIPLPSSQIVRVGYIPIAISKFTSDRKTSQQFIDFLVSGDGKDIFRKYKYFMSTEEAFAYIGEKKPVGGEYEVPKEWIQK